MRAGAKLLDVMFVNFSNPDRIASSQMLRFVTSTHIIVVTNLKPQPIDCGSNLSGDIYRKRQAD